MPWCNPGLTESGQRAWIEAQVTAFQTRTAFEFAIVGCAERYLGGCGLNQFDVLNRRANWGTGFARVRPGKASRLRQYDSSFHGPVKTAEMLSFVRMDRSRQTLLRLFALDVVHRFVACIRGTDPALLSGCCPPARHSRVDGKRIGPSIATFRPAHRQWSGGSRACSAGRLRAPRAPASAVKTTSPRRVFRGVEPEARRNMLAVRRDAEYCGQVL